MFRILVYVLMLCIGSTAHASDPLCVRPEQLARNSVRIYAEVIKYEGNIPYTATVGGTGWFINPTHVVTVAHVASVFASPYVWTGIELTQTTMGAKNTLRTERIPVRVKGVHETHSREKLVVLELERPFIGAQSAYFRDTPLEPGEPIVGIGYPAGVFRVVTGTFLSARNITLVQNRTITEYQVDVSAGDDRAAFGPGASGSPFFDCAGRVVLSLSEIKRAGFTYICSDESTGCTPGEPGLVEFTPPKGSGTHTAVPTSGVVRFSQTLTVH